MLLSDKLEIRRKGWSSILACRLNKSDQHFKKIPPIHWRAKCWTQLVPSKGLSFEPIETIQIPTDSVKSYAKTGYFVQLEVYPSHSQGVEQAVRYVSDASKKVYGKINRHKSILCSLKCREVRPAFSSKGYYKQNQGSRK